MNLKWEIPLVCPFCDELAYSKYRAKRITLPHKIYTLRKCPMGHEFYSVEYVPESQAEIVEEMKQTRRDALDWSRTLKAHRDAEN